MDKINTYIFIQVKSKKDLPKKKGEYWVGTDMTLLFKYEFDPKKHLTNAWDIDFKIWLKPINCKQI